MQRARRDDGEQEGGDDDLDDYKPFVSIKDRRKLLVRHPIVKSQLTSHADTRATTAPTPANSRGDPAPAGAACEWQHNDTIINF